MFANCRAGHGAWCGGSAYFLVAFGSCVAAALMAAVGALGTFYREKVNGVTAGLSAIATGAYWLGTRELMTSNDMTTLDAIVRMHQGTTTIARGSCTYLSGIALTCFVASSALSVAGVLPVDDCPGPWPRSGTMVRVRIETKHI